MGVFLNYKKIKNYYVNKKKFIGRFKGRCLRKMLWRGTSHLFPYKLSSLLNKKVLKKFILLKKIFLKDL